MGTLKRDVYIGKQDAALRAAKAIESFVKVENPSKRFLICDDIVNMRKVISLNDGIHGTEQHVIDALDYSFGASGASANVDDLISVYNKLVGLGSSSSSTDPSMYTPSSTTITATPGSPYDFYKEYSAGAASQAQNAQMRQEQIREQRLAQMLTLLSEALEELRVRTEELDDSELRTNDPFAYRVQRNAFNTLFFKLTEALQRINEYVDIKNLRMFINSLGLGLGR